MNEPSLQTMLERFAAPMALSRPEGKLRVRCLACAHRCLIPDGHPGICRVRYNRGGVLYGPRGYVADLQDDPIEKKPFFHVLPGSRSISFGMLGCNYHCSYCQNWLTSQALRDEGAGAPVYEVTAGQIVEHARRAGALTVTSTYNEPLIAAEWGVEVFRAAKEAGLGTCFVSNGYNTPEAIAYLRPWLDACNVDLKTFRDRRYRELGGTLKGVLEGIERLHAAGIWMEVITLVVPGFNDSDAELGEMAAWLAALSPDIPWHVTAFFPDYHMRSPPATPPAALIRAHEIGRAAGLRYVYAGNLPGRVGERENTRCPRCDTLLVERDGIALIAYHLKHGHCPQCGTEIPGRWHDDATQGAISLETRGVRPFLLRPRQT